MLFRSGGQDFEGKNYNEDFWEYTIVNESSRNLFLKDFIFTDGEGNGYSFKNAMEGDKLDISKTVTLEPNRSTEIFYNTKVLKPRNISISPQAFYIEEENGKKHFLDKSFRKKKGFR